MWTIHGYPFEIIAPALILAAILVVLFMWLRRYVVPLLHGRVISRLMNKWLPRLEIVTWVVYAVLLIVLLFQQDLLLTGILLVLVCVVGWGIWRDLFIGLYFRLAGRFLPGEPMNAGTIVGKVMHSHTRDLEVLLHDGGRVWIPYSKLAAEVIGQQNTATNSQRRSFQVEVQDMTKADARIKIEQLLRRDPWVAASRPVTITPESDALYNVDVQLIDADMLVKVQGALTKALAKDIGGSKPSS